MTSKTLRSEIEFLLILLALITSITIITSSAAVLRDYQVMEFLCISFASAGALGGFCVCCALAKKCQEHAVVRKRRERRKLVRKITKNLKAESASAVIIHDW